MLFWRKPWPTQRLSVLELCGFFLGFAVLLLAGHILYADPIAYNSDDIRYINYALNLHAHNVFGLGRAEPPPPGNANAPLYLFWLAGIMKIDPGLVETLRCVFDNGSDWSHCKQNLELFFTFQYGLALISLFLVFITALEFSGKRSVGWLAALLAFLSLKLITFSTIFMTEIMIIPPFFAMIYFLLRLIKSGQFRWVFLIGAMLALLTLTRPSYLYLFYGFVLFFAGIACWQRTRVDALKFCVLVLSFILVVSPWAIRNKILFNDYTLTTGQYGEIILSERVSYNRMNWTEWGVSFIYWAPSFGDSLAEKLFPKEYYERLSWDAGSYYKDGRKLYRSFVEEAGGEDHVFKYIVKEKVLGDLFKHVMVSMPLAWRAVFFSKEWGMLGLACTIALLIQTLRRKDYRLLLLSLPFAFIVAFHAGVSVSIARYNVPLMLLYALCMAHYADIYGSKIVQKISRK